MHDAQRCRENIITHIKNRKGGYFRKMGIGEGGRIRDEQSIIMYMMKML